MKHALMLAGLAGTLMLFPLSPTRAAETMQEHAEHHAATQEATTGTMTCPCPMCQMMMGGEAGAKPEMQAMMQKMGMSEEMMQRHRTLMQLQVQPGDPAALLAMREQLNLTEEQAEKLRAILEKARIDARTVLTDAQEQQVAKMGTAPFSMMEMRRKMMPMMQKMMQKMMPGAQGPGGMMQGHEGHQMPQP